MSLPSGSGGVESLAVAHHDRQHVHPPAGEGVIYAAVFLALAEDSGTVMVTADTKLPSVLEGTPYSRLAHSLDDVASLIPTRG